jgi:predicted metalloendopeptidase
MARMLHKPTDRDMWITPPSIVNAFFYPSMNSITFPAGILQPPFFQSNRLQALNYGGIGMVIGHEMTHGLD